MVVFLAAVLSVSVMLTADTIQGLSAHGDPITSEVSCGSEYCEDNGCACDTVGCEAPTYAACNGNCACDSQTCG